LSRDPIQEWGGLNLYAYVGNNTINAIDPDGRFFWLIPILITAFVCGAVMAEEPANAPGMLDHGQSMLSYEEQLHASVSPHY
jgi:hypothetical protein